MLHGEPDLLDRMRLAHPAHDDIHGAERDPVAGLDVAGELAAQQFADREALVARPR